MKLPKTISPCPIQEAVAEVQFESSLPADAVFGVAYQALKESFPNSEPLPILSLPADLRNSAKDLKFQPHYRLLNETTTVLVGPRVISVGTRREYPGWAAHSRRIRETLALLHGTGIVAQPLRLGLRYIRFFALDIYPKLNLTISVDGTSLVGDETFLKTVLAGEGCRCLLQVGKGVALLTNPGQTGSVVDIDSFTTATNGEFLSVLAQFLEEAHQAQKELFFRLLKPEFLATLNPVYDDAN